MYRSYPFLLKLSHRKLTNPPFTLDHYILCQEEVDVIMQLILNEWEGSNEINVSQVYHFPFNYD